MRASGIEAPLPLVLGFLALALAALALGALCLRSAGFVPKGGSRRRPQRATARVDAGARGGRVSEALSLPNSPDSPRA